MPSTYASPRAVSLVVFTDIAIVRREISSSISYTASFLGTICLEVPLPIPTVYFLHLAVALQRRTVYDFMISRHLLPDRELREREHLMLLGNILQAVIHFHEMIAFFDNIAARGKMAVFVDAGIPAIPDYGLNTIRRAINRYGTAPQLQMAIKEMSELTKAICNLQRATTFNYRNGAKIKVAHESVREEIADVYIMLAQLVEIVGKPEEVQQIVLEKLEQLKGALDGGEVQSE